MQKTKIITLLLLTLFLFSCAHSASLIETSYKVLTVSQVSYDTSMKVIADLNKQGLVEPNDLANILKAADVYYTAHNVAVDLLAKYSETESLSDKALLEKQITLVSESLTNLLTIIKPYLGDKHGT